VGGLNFNLPVQATALLQQAFRVMKNTEPKQIEDAKKCTGEKGKATTKLEPIEHITKVVPHSGKPEASHQAAWKEGRVARFHTTSIAKQKGL
jgi:hypothetical protein